MLIYKNNVYAISIYMHTCIYKKLKQYLKLNSQKKVSEMGGKQSKNETQATKIFQSKNTHPKFGGAQIVQTESKQNFTIQMMHSVGNQEMLRKWEENISKYCENNKHQEALYFPMNLNFKEEGICGRSGVIKAQYDFFPYILKDQILNRKAIGQNFSENQLWYMVYILCCAGAGIHQKGYIIGDTRPQNVFINQNGEIRVSNLYTFIDENTNYHKFCTSKQKTFLAPQQIQQLQQGKLHSNVDLPKAECFSIGLTLLSAILISNQSQLYQTQSLQFNHQQFNHDITTLKSLKNYNECLLGIVSGLCEYDPRFRLSCAEIVEALEPYEESILDLEDFQINVNDLSENLKSKCESQQLIGSSARGSYAKVVNLKDSRSKTNTNRPKSYHSNENSYYLSQNARQRELPPVRHAQISRQLPPMLVHNNPPPPSQFINNSFQSINSNQTNFTFQGSQNMIPHSREFNANNMSFNQTDISSIRPVPRNFSSNNQYSQDYSVNTSFNTMTPQGYYNSVSQNTDKGRQQANGSKNQGQRFILPSDISQTNHSNPSELSVFRYGSKVDSYIPPPPYTNNVNFLQAQNSQSIYIASQNPAYQKPQIKQVSYQNDKPTLLSMGRQTTSIRPDTSQWKSNQSNSLFRSYEDALRNVDRKLEESRKMFPE